MTRVTFARVVHSEWIKLRSVRSTSYLVGLMVLTLAGLGAHAALGDVVAGSNGSAGYTPDPLGGALHGVGVAEPIAGLLGVLAVTREYAAGGIRATFTVVPRRGYVLVGRTLVVAVVVLTAALIGVIVAFLGAKLILAQHGQTTSLSHPGVIRALVGGAAYLAVVSSFAGAFAWLLRSTAGALAAVLTLLYVLPVATLFLPRGLSDRVVAYVPNNAGIAVMQLDQGGLLAPWTGLGLFTAYAVLALAGALTMVLRRDA